MTSEEIVDSAWSGWKRPAGWWWKKVSWNVEWNTVVRRLSLTIAVLKTISLVADIPLDLGVYIIKNWAYLFKGDYNLVVTKMK